MFRRSLTAAACGVYILGIGSGACTGPNQAELQSYRVLVPDWSKTSGGYSPALSPDGKTLAYLSQGKVWILSDLDKYDLPSEDSDTQPSVPEAWALRIEVPDVESRSLNVASDTGPDLDTTISSPSRSLDWSPDGKRLALIYQGRLFIAEGFDFKNKTAKSRMVADVTVASYGGRNPAGESLMDPRWSPDGTKIAFVRPPEQLPAPGLQVAVLDMRTGRESVVAQDAWPGGTWGQPWSPDSKSLVYAHSQSEGSVEAGSMTLGPQGISTVRVLEQKPTSVVESDMALTPSWSPKGDKLAYSAPSEHKGTFVFLQSVMVCDQDGKNSRVVAGHAPAKEETEAAMVEVGRRVQRLLREQYPDVFTEEQLRQLTGTGMTENSAVNAVMFAWMIKNGPSIAGEEFEALLKDTLEKHTSGGEDIRKLMESGKPPFEPLPEEKREALLAAMNREFTPMIMDILRPMFWVNARFDRMPTWSQDGSKLAFVRWNLAAGTRQLISADVATEHSRVLFDEDNIAGILWSRAGTAVVTVASRNLAYKGVGWNEKTNWPEFSTMPSYPEIWLIEPK